MQYAAGSEPRVRPPARQDPPAQQEAGEISGLGACLSNGGVGLMDVGCRYGQDISGVGA